MRTGLMIRCLCGMTLALLAGAAAWGASNERDPYVGYIYPAGGQQGATFQVLAAGQRLRGARGAVVTGGGIQVKVLDYVGPMGPLNREQQEELQDRIREIMRQRFAKGREMPTPQPEKKGQETPAAQPAKPKKEIKLPDLPELRDLEKKTPMELREIGDKYCNPKKRPKPPIAEEVTLEITIDAGAIAGDREIRLRTASGLSNPLLFQVGTLPERSQPAGEERVNNPPSTLTAPVTFNGQIMPGQVDRYPLQLHAGQRLVASAHARKLIPYLADAVPGWFQAALALYDADGKEVAFNDDNGCDPDPLLTYLTPRDGVYQLEIRDAIYRGRQDFVYRIDVTEQAATAPVVDVGRAPAATLDELLPRAELPRGEEAEPNDAGKGTKPLALPRVISGRIALPGDVDVYQFAGRAGDAIVVEVYARRLGSPMDALVRLIDANGRVVAWNDDCEDKSLGLLTHHADSCLTTKLPTTCAYFVQVSEAQRHGGAEYRYAVRISAPIPDFALRVTPSSVNVNAGRAAEITVFALRKDGWNGDIDIALTNAPAGFALNGAHIPAGRESVRMTLTAPSETGRRNANEPIILALEGRAQVNGATITRPVMPTERLMQAFAYYQLVPARQLDVIVNRGMRGAPFVALTNTNRVRIPAGSTVEVTCVVRPMPIIQLVFELSNPPAGVTLAESKITPDGVTLVLSADDTHTGYADNLIVEVFTEIEFKRPDGGEARKQRVSAGVLPAIAFEIAAP